MGQRVIQMVEYTDDLNGQVFAEGEGETIVYGFEGTTYEIDLNHANAAEFRDVIGPYLKASRRSPGAAPKKQDKRTPRRDREEMARIRAWGRNNGYAVPDKGRLPYGLTEAWDRFNAQPAR